MTRILPGETDIYALTDARLSLGRPLEEVARALLGAGVKILQYREKKAKAGQMLEECRLLRRLTAEAGACFVVNDHIDIALLVKADGVHVGQEDLPLACVRELVGPEMLIGLSTHSPEQARAAVVAGADYIGVGAVFPSSTKPDAIPVTLAQLRDICAAVTIPAVAIGGINWDNMDELAGSGVAGVAVSSALFGAPNVESEARSLWIQAENLFCPSLDL